MTERTIRTLAKELAGQFYDQKRSGRFRDPNGLTRAFVLKQMPDGTAVELPVKVPFIKAYPTSKSYSKAHWPHFVDAARACLTAMLGMPEHVIHQNLKDAIYAALLEDRNNQHRQDLQKNPLTPNGGSLLQQRVIDHASR